MRQNRQIEPAAERIEQVTRGSEKCVEPVAGASSEQQRQRDAESTEPALMPPNTRHRRVHLRGEGDLVRYIGGSAGISRIIREAGGDPTAFVVSVAPTTEARSGHLFSVHVESIATDRGATYLADARARWLSQLRQDLIRGRFAAR